MRVYISADIEGVTGVVAWGQCGGPSAEHYDWAFARRMMTHDVNAAIRGARAAGASEVVVKDSHGSSKNLLVDGLEAGTQLISGHGAGTGGMMAGLDASFDCALLVGYHARAGTAKGIMEHTISGRVHDLRINGMPAGEIAISTATAGSFGVPVVAVTSDFAGVREAEVLLPGVCAVAVKEGFGRYMGRLLHPSETGPRIEETARQGVAQRKGIAPWRPSEPVELEVEFNRGEEADTASRLPVWIREGGYQLRGYFANWTDAHESLRLLLNLAADGSRAG